MSKTTIPNRSNWEFSFIGDDTTLPSKDDIILNNMYLMFARTNNIFRYKNLPNTIKERDLEFLIQSQGYGVGIMHEGKPYVLYGTMAGVLNEQYLPTQAIVTNPYLKLSKTYTIGEDCVIWRNDSCYQGLKQLARRYSTLLGETEISMKYNAIQSRILCLINAKDDRTKDSAEIFLQKIWNGEDLGVIAGNSLLDNLETYPYGQSTNTYIKALIELHQYLKATWFIDLGVNANYNMKRESLSVDEVGVNEKSLLPLIDDMLKNRELAVKEFNEMFGTNIEVELNSAWEIIERENDLELQNAELQVEELKVETETSEGGEEDDRQE